jgi:2-hydroxycyclohexanecarboxyl-CoA dehydrogenase
VNAEAPLYGKNAVVTGGASGIGRATAEKLIRAGAGVVLFDIDGEAGRTTAKDLATTEAHVSSFAVDVADRDQVVRAADAARTQVGPLQILVNSAGIDCISPFMSLDGTTWQRVLDVNLTGMFHCIQAVAPDMLKARWGRIINISSAAAQRGSSRKMSAYSASKGAVISLTRSLAHEFGEYGITVNCVAPNFVFGQMHQRAIERGEIEPEFFQSQIDETPVRRIGTPDDVAATCVFLATADAGFVSSQTIGVNGGRFP